MEIRHYVYYLHLFYNDVLFATVIKNCNDLKINPLPVIDYVLGILLFRNIFFWFNIINFNRDVLVLKGAYSFSL